MQHPVGYAISTATGRPQLTDIWVALLVLALPDRRRQQRPHPDPDHQHPAPAPCWRLTTLQNQNARAASGTAPAGCGASGSCSPKVTTVVVAIFLPVVLAYTAWTYYVFRRRLSDNDFRMQQTAH